MAAKGQIKYSSRDTDLAWAIITAVCARYRVEPMVMCSHDRRLHVAFARQIAMYLIRGMTNMSSPAIGELFEHDHSTVLKTQKVIAARVVAWPALGREFERLVAEIQAELAAKAVT